VFILIPRAGSPTRTLLRLSPNHWSHLCSPLWKSFGCYQLF